MEKKLRKVSGISIKIDTPISYCETDRFLLNHSKEMNGWTQMPENFLWGCMFGFIGGEEVGE